MRLDARTRFADATEDKAKEVSFRKAYNSHSNVSQEIELLKDVAEFEDNQEQCASYLCLVPLEGDQTIMTVFEKVRTNKDKYAHPS